MFDMKNLKRLRHLADLAPDAWKAFQQFDQAATAEGELSVKTKELIAVAVALSTQCAYCIEVHLRKAKKAGASDKELAEAAMVTVALRAGGALAHAAHVLPQD